MYLCHTLLENLWKIGISFIKQTGKVIWEGKSIKHGLLKEFGRGTKNCTFLEWSDQSIKHFLLEFGQIGFQNSIEVFCKQFPMNILG